jgi:hypothetical protein
MEQDATRGQIRALLEGQPFGVLCTQGEGQPYGSVVAFAHDDELCSLVFATPVETHKYRMLVACDRVALVIDDRGLYPDDVRRAAAITAIGRALRLQTGMALSWWRARLLERHPQLAAFLGAQDNALFRVDVERYKLVTHLQEVSIWNPWGS